MEDLETMRQDYLELVKAKLEEWGVEVPEGDRPLGFCRSFKERRIGSFGLFKQ
jgi:1,2-phenylacetyl-CoA epoxidase catalytic subunit